MNGTMDDNYKLQALGDKGILFGIKTSNVYIGLLNQVMLLAKKFNHHSKLSSEQHVSFLVFLITPTQQADIHKESYACGATQQVSRRL